MVSTSHYEVSCTDWLDCHQEFIHNNAIRSVTEVSVSTIVMWIFKTVADVINKTVSLLHTPGCSTHVMRFNQTSRFLKSCISTKQSASAAVLIGHQESREACKLRRRSWCIQVIQCKDLTSTENCDRSMNEKAQSSYNHTDG